MHNLLWWRCLLRILFTPPRLAWKTLPRLNLRLRHPDYWQRFSGFEHPTSVFGSEVKPSNRSCLTQPCLGDIFGSVIMACINPHRLGLAGTLKSTLAVEIHCATVGEERVLVEVFIRGHKSSHKFRPNTMPLIFRQHEQMRIKHHQVPVRDRVAESNERGVSPSCHE